MILLAVPSHILLTDLQSHVMQARNWLQGMFQVKLDVRTRLQIFTLAITEKDCLEVFFSF